MSTVAIQCGCGVPGRVWRGHYCRCCGEPLGGAHRVVFCDRTRYGPCPYCRRDDSCGPHANHDQSAMPPRRFCEFDGQPCNPSGRCQTHGHAQALVR